MTNILTTAAIVIIGISTLVILLLIFYKKVTQGQALIRSGFGGTKVVFDRGILTIPFVHKLDKIDLTIKKVDIHRIKSEALICKNNKQIELKAAFFVRINRSVEDMIRVAQTFGCERTFNNDEISNLFRVKFEETLKTIAYRFNKEEILENRDVFRDEIVHHLGTDHNGYSIDDCAIYDIVENET
ncbi:SPFH domain-containing protein [uncultured Aquimarina sp.]|uniref:SPFH domain-containing protein n=1 Tax=uncultured Aquimarina sp. TaxID=575652 RepID=UPI002638F3B7|nr:SPFH domain-containing protein [uncultured Aquimarina sp.]